MRTKNFISAILVFFLLIQVVFSQIRFQKTYGGAGDDVAWNVIQTSDHGYLLSGYTTSFGNGLRDAYIIKTDSLGNKQWSKTIGGSLNDEAITAFEDNGSYVIGGYTNSYGAGNADGFLARLSLSGAVLWFKTYGTSEADYTLLRFTKTLDNGFVLAYTLSVGSHFKYTLVKTDANGTMLWSKSYGGSATDVSGGVMQAPDSSFIVTGFSNNFGSGQHNFLISKTNSLGIITWSKSLLSSSSDGGSYFIVPANTNHALITGQSSNGLFGTDNIVFIKLNYSSGTISWAKEYGKAGKALRAYSGTVTLENGFASDIHDYTAGVNHDMGILRTDSTGTLLWSKKYGGPGDDVAYSIHHTYDDGFALAGFTNSFGSNGKDIYFVKSDASGRSGSINGCNEMSDSLSSGLYNVSLTTPTVPALSASNLNNNFILTGIVATDSVLVLCSCPPITLSLFNPVCINSAPVLLSGGLPVGGTYSGTGVTNGIFNPAIAGVGIHLITYHFSSSGCIDSTSSAISVDALPTILASPDTSICPGNTVALHVTGADTYSWSPSIGLNSTSGSSVLASPASTTTYWIIGSTIHNCSNSTPVVVTVFPILQIPVTPPGPILICGNNSVTLSTNFAQGYQYQWYRDSIPVPFATSSQVTVNSIGNFSVHVTDANGCGANSQEVIISASSLGPVVTISASAFVGCLPNTIYFGYGPQSITLTAHASGSVAYLWSTGDTTQSITVNSAGTYSVTAWDVTGCASQQTIQSQYTIRIVDVRCGNDLRKIILCHVPPGNSGNPQSICIAPNAIPAHLSNHQGDCIGPCTLRSDPVMEAEVETGTTSIYPNPFKIAFAVGGYFHYEKSIKLNIYDFTGRIVESHSDFVENGLFGYLLTAGIYSIEIVFENEKQMFKIIKF